MAAEALKSEQVNKSGLAAEAPDIEQAFKSGQVLRFSQVKKTGQGCNFAISAELNLAPHYVQIKNWIK